MLPDFWKEIREPSDIYESLGPLLFISCSSGITPFRVRGRKGQRKLEVSSFGVMYTVLHIFIMAICYYRTFVRRETIIGYFFDTDISKVGDGLQMMTGIVGISVIYSMSYCRRDDFIAIVKILANIDDQLLSIGVKVNYKKLLFYSCATFILMTIFNLAYLGGSYGLLRSMDLHPPYVVYASFFLPHLVTSVVVLIFSCITRLISDRFIVLNKVLVNMIENFDRQTDKIRKKSIPFTREPSEKFMSWLMVMKTPDETIEEVTHIHDMLCDLATITNDFFTVQMLAITGIAFLIIIFDAYYIFGTYLGLSSLRATAFIIFFSSQLILYAFEVFVIVHGSTQAVSQSQMTSIYVHKLLNLTKEESVKDALYKLSLQLLHRKICFDAAGFFVLDRTLFFTISGATTTYLIILLQFSSENEIRSSLLDSSIPNTTGN